MPLKHFADSRDQIGSQMSLADIATGAGGKCGRNKIALLVNRQKYDLGSALGVPQTGRSLKPIQDWHRNVDHEHVRVQPANRIDSVFPVCGGVDNLKLRAQFPANLSEKGLVIISKQHSNRGHKNSLKRTHWHITILQALNLLGERELSTVVCDRFLAIAGGTLKPPLDAGNHTVLHGIVHEFCVRRNP